MKVLVTGATGFLGSHLVKILLQEGHRIVILKRSFSDTRRISEVMADIIFYDIDMCELERPFREQGKIDAVIHTATSYGRKGESVYEVFEANTAFPLRILATASLFHVPIFLNPSSVLHKELNAYALSKRQFEEWGKQFADAGRIRFVNIRTEHMYGPGDDRTKFPAHVINSCLENVPELELTAGEQKRDFIYIDDVVSAYLLLLDCAPKQVGLFQEYALGCGQAVSIREFVETVHDITSSKTVLKFGALPHRKHEIMHSYANIEPLKKLGWTCRVDLRDGIKRIVEVERRRLKKI